MSYRTVSATTLARILKQSTLSQQLPAADWATQSIPQPSPALTDVSYTDSGLQYVESRSSISTAALVSSLSTSLSSLPYAYVWVVNLAYPPSALSTPGFGLLCASHHSTDGLLGIAFDSCVFPQHSTAHPLSQPATRLTVMLGGARFPQFAQSSAATAQTAAVAAVRDKLAVTAEPLWVEARLATECIPQYVVGHSRWVASLEGAVDELNRRLGGGDGRRRFGRVGCCHVRCECERLYQSSQAVCHTVLSRASEAVIRRGRTWFSEAGVLPVAAK